MATTRAILYRILLSLPENTLWPFEFLYQCVNGEAPTATRKDVADALQDINRDVGLVMRIFQMGEQCRQTFALSHKITERSIGAFFIGGADIPTEVAQ